MVARSLDAGIIANEIRFQVFFPARVRHSGRVITEEARMLLERFRMGEVSLDEVIRHFQAAPVADLGFAQVDLHRALRKGFPEVIFGSGKTLHHVIEIARRIVASDSRVLITRVSAEWGPGILDAFPGALYYSQARCVVIQEEALPKLPGYIAVLAAGTSDLPVAEEAMITAETMGNKVRHFYDVGVAGLHRLLAHLPEIQKANVIIAVAGMEGAMPSVVAGLVSRPVIAVPTSIGYGANFGGLAALLGMLNSCGSGVTVVNIDNGFGAGYAAAQINALAAEKK